MYFTLSFCLFVPFFPSPLSFYPFFHANSGLKGSKPNVPHQGQRWALNLLKSGPGPPPLVANPRGKPGLFPVTEDLFWDSLSPLPTPLFAFFLLIQKRKGSSLRGRSRFTLPHYVLTSHGAAAV